jgi:lipopolysaccharide transport system permease protein
LIPLVLMFLFYRVIPGPSLLALPFFALLIAVAATAIGVWLAALSVGTPDVSMALPPAFRALLYLTPILYPISRIPEPWQALVYLNPLTVIFQGYRWALWGYETPPLMILLVTIFLFVIGLIASLLYFRHTVRWLITCKIWPIQLSRLKI